MVTPKSRKEHANKPNFENVENSPPTGSFGSGKIYPISVTALGAAEKGPTVPHGFVENPPLSTLSECPLGENKGSHEVTSNRDPSATDDSGIESPNEPLKLAPHNSTNSCPSLKKLMATNINSITVETVNCHGECTVLWSTGNPNVNKPPG